MELQLKKYKVVIEGTNFLIRGEKSKMGFFTTRFVEAPGEEKAEMIAIDLIKDELKDSVVNPKSDSPMLYLDSITEGPFPSDAQIPGKGFSWYIEEA